MGALCGYTGSPDESLIALMTRTLAHRGTGKVDIWTGDAATFSLRAPHAPGCVGTVEPRIFDVPERNLTIALCGLILGWEGWEGAPGVSASMDDLPSSFGLRHAHCGESLANTAVANRAVTPTSRLDDGFYHHLAQAYQRVGPDVVHTLRGSFILAIRDGNTIHLSRDAAGNRTVYYARLGTRWIFGIEPKAISTVPSFAKKVRPAAIAQYLACSFTPGAGTMLEGLYELQAGHTVTLRCDREPQRKRWFCFEHAAYGVPQDNGTDSKSDVASPWKSESEIIQSFRDEMERAVAERIPRGEPVGVFLSGGLDSSLVVAELARQLGGRNVRTWALHFGPRYANELDFARAVADHCGTVHEEVLIQPRKFLPRLRRMVWHLDEPIGDPITQPNFELAAHVSREVRFIFNGEGGDPCFGGPKNIPMLLGHWYGVAREPNFRERQYLQSYRRAWEEIDVLLTDDIRNQIDLERDLDGLFAPYLRASDPRYFLHRLTSINIREKGAHLIQPKVERMLAAHGLVPLAPLFDERIIQFSFRMPPRMILDQGVEKVILKRAYADLLPAQVINRPKSGMRVPVHYWFQSELRRYAQNVLSRRNLSEVGWFKPERVEQLRRYEVEEGRGRFGLRLWMLLTLELWRRIVVDGEPI